jgi:hypothetical protein
VEEIFLKVLNYLPENSIVVPTGHYGQPYSGIEDQVETEDNVCNADKGAGLDLEKMAEERDTYR